MILTFELTEVYSIPENGLEWQMILMDLFAMAVSVFLIYKFTNFPIFQKLKQKGSS